MKKALFILIAFLLAFSIIGCKKVTEAISGGGESNTQYVKEYGAWVFANEEDLGKEAKDVDKQQRQYLEFGSKLNVLKSKEVEGKEYLKVQLPDKSEYWVLKDNLAERFIVIDQDNVEVYSQPDQDYKTGIKLQTGDFGIFVKEQEGWTNVEFFALRPEKEGEERKWVGNKWIKDGFTDDLNAAREAYKLYLAYYYQITKKDTAKAKKFLEEGLEVNKGDKSVIYGVLEDYMSELE